ncbi:Na+/H+ antiporter NhaA [Micromonospora sp. 067-2]|uniref:Na+/H+ antiporter NhaA n=1 Tax=Micromonospora sp. 067-2 TaxID=2789270 RepID=UPI0039784F27
MPQVQRTMEPDPTTSMAMTPAGSTARRGFPRSGSAGATLLVAAVAVALVWANLPSLDYDGFWSWVLTVQLGPWAAHLDLRTWVNSGLMTLFFLVVGLEARREFDLGDLRERRRVALPVLAGGAGMVIPVIVYLIVNHGGAGAQGWGIAMSTDTALALGAFSLIAAHAPGRIRTFVLTVFVVDDLVALIVIAVAYSEHIAVPGMVVAVVAFAGLLTGRRLPHRLRGWSFALGTVLTWAGLLSAGIDPVVAGLAAGLAATAYTPSRTELEEATRLVRLFREQPSAKLAALATRSLTGALSANSRMRHTLHAATSYGIVPLFALANAGIVVDGDMVGQALRSPITIGVVLAYVVGKPAAVVITSWLAERLSGGSLRPPVGWGAVLESGTIAGIGFTVSLLIANLAFSGDALDQAKIGTLAAAAGAALLSFAVHRIIETLPAGARARALLGTAGRLVDLAEPVNDDRDHIQGPPTAVVTVVEYGDFECPWTAMVGPTAQELLVENADVRYVWRHLPLPDVHPYAQEAAEAAEAAEDQGAFWPMHTLLLERQDRLTLDDLTGYAEQLGLDLDQFRDDLVRRRHEARVQRDIDSADRSGVAGTPTFFINGQRHDGPQDLATLNRVIDEARAQAAVVSR